jgi:hypothetical protein
MIGIEAEVVKFKRNTDDQFAEFAIDLITLTLCLEYENLVESCKVAVHPGIQTVKDILYIIECNINQGERPNRSYQS